MKRLFALGLGLVVLLSFSSGYAASVTSTVKDQQDVAVTIYNSNVGLVKDVRSLNLGTGVTDLKFMDVAAKIDPTTVHIKPLTDGASFSILEQNYEYDLLNPQKLLEKYVGQRVQLITVNPETKKEEVTDAVLLSTQGGNIFQIGERISIGHPGRILLPRIPDNLIPQPTLVWKVENRFPRPQKVEASYLTQGITWKADYVAVLNAADTRLDLTGWVTLDNKSGATYENARLKLVAGDIHRVQPPPQPARRAMAKGMAADAAAPQFTEESFFEYHLYTLDRRTTVKDNQTKQMTLLDASGAPVKKLFLFAGAPQSWFFRTDQRAKQKVGVFLELENSQKNNLGMPLPKGTVRVYKEDREGSLQFIGEDQIDHTPKDEKIKVKIGEAFDVVAERIQTDYKSLAPNLYEAAFEVSLRNHKKEDIRVLVEEPVPGDWEMLSNSHPYEKVQARQIRFNIPVPKDQEVKVRYRVRFKY